MQRAISPGVERAATSVKSLGFSLLSSRTFIKSVLVGLGAGFGAMFIKYVENNYSFYGEKGFLHHINPDTVVFNVFIVFASLVAAFRTSHALERYVNAAALMHRQSSAWFNAVLSLLTYTRNSTAPKEDIKRFQELCVRLFSLVSGLCLKGLEHKEVVFEMGHTFDVLGWGDLSSEFQKKVMAAPCKVEYVFQAIDALVMQAMTTGIMNIPPPILAGVFNEMGAASSTYHEAKKYSKVPMPYAYKIIINTMLVAEAVFVPFMLAGSTRGYFSAFLFTAGGTFMMWFIIGVSENLDNPFRKEAYNLEVSRVQDEMNEKLLQLLEAEDEAPPALSADYIAGRGKGGTQACQRQSVQTLGQAVEDKKA